MANTKTSSRKKSTGRKPSKTSKKKNTKSAKKRKEEITGVVLCAIGILLMVCMLQSSSTGIIGPVVKSALNGSFGSFGYVIPMGIIIIGIILILKKKAGVKPADVILWTILVLCVIMLYHTFFFRPILTSKVRGINFNQYIFTDFVKDSYFYGAGNGLSSGALGAILTYAILKALGVFGCVIIPVTYIALFTVIKGKFSFHVAGNIAKDRINEQSRQIHENIRQTRDQRRVEIASYKRKKQPLFVEDLSGGNHHSNSEEVNFDFLSKGHERLGEHTKTYQESLEEKWNIALDGEYSNGETIDVPIPDNMRFLRKEEPVGIDDTASMAIEDEVEVETKSEDISDDKPTIHFLNDDEADIDDTTDTKTKEKLSTGVVYQFPNIDLLKPSRKYVDTSMQDECHANAIILEQTLKSFKVDAKVVNITCGPTVTRYELRPAPGVRVSKIDNLYKDLAMALAARSLRIEAPIPNKSAVGIEVPNRKRAIVRLRDILEGQKFKTAESPITICVGKDITGRNIIADLSKMPHMLVAGATGSGKSVFINSLIISMLYKSSPDDVRMIMIDPKKVELNVYNGIPHLLIPVVTKPSMAASALNWAVKEMLRRYEVFSENLVRNLDGFNKLAAEPDNDLEKMPRIVIIVDELADLMQVSSAEVEDAIFRLAQLARAAGMHLVIATQRPDVKVITGTIKANIPCRVAFSVNQFVDSKTILDQSGAEHLLGNGDMLYKTTGKPIRLQGAFVDDKEVEEICKSIMVEDVKYDDEVIEDVKNLEKQASGEGGKGGKNYDDEFDNLIGDAVNVIFNMEKASTSMVQRKLRVGYNRAGRIMDDLERLGIVGPPEGSKPREILVTLGTANDIIAGVKN